MESPRADHPITVLLADGHAVFRAGVRLLLESEPDIEVVGEAATGERAIALAASLRPDVVLLDAAMTTGGGGEATRRILEANPDARILVLVVNPIDETRENARAAGARGFLSKLRADVELSGAIRTVASDGRYFRPEPLAALASSNGGGRPQRGEPDTPLSVREREVVSLTALGFSSREIGERLGISSKTVDTYRARSMEKLGLRHRWELVRYALRTGLLAADS